MALKRLKIEQLKNKFENGSRFTLQDIVEFYREFEKDLKRTTVSWRINSLVQRGILQRVGRGVYILGEEGTYTPEISKELKSIYKKIKKEFPFIEICVWNTKWLNEFMIHQPNRFYVLIEAEKEAAESVFYCLREKNSAVFLEPSREVFEKYLPDNKIPIIVKALVSEAPLMKIEGITTATIEKILIDIFCDDIIFSAQQGSEMRKIFDSAYAKYSVNQSKLIRYADRRGKKKEITEFTEQFIRQLKNIT